MLTQHLPTVLLVLAALAQWLKTTQALSNLIPSKWQWIPGAALAASGLATELLSKATSDTEIVNVALAVVVLVVGYAQRGHQDDNAGKPPSGGGNILPASLLALGALLLGGCAGTFEEARIAGIQRHRELGAAVSDRTRCVQLDNRRTTWGAIAVGAGVLAVPAGLASIPVKNDEAQAGLVAGSVAAAALTVSAKLVADNASHEWVAEGCGK